MQAIADSRLRDLSDERVNVMHNERLQRASTSELVTHNAGSDPPTFSGNLGYRPIRSCITAQEKRQSDEAVVSSEAHFRGRSLLGRVEQ